jgi:hypothetical protein
MASERPAPILLAGAWSDERQPPLRAGAEAGWHLPRHVRQPAEARRHLAEQVRAGADAITAPTFLTSRRALARFGEARRAREWTAAAVTLARDAAQEAGRQVLVCGSLTPTERFASAEADQQAFEAHAGTIAEAGVDVILVELMRSAAAGRAATLAAVATGLPVWSGAALETGEWLGEWAEAVEPAEPERLLLYAEPEAARHGLEELARLTSRPLGACLLSPAAPDDVAALLERGAGVVGLADHATAAALHAMREAVDERLATLAVAAGENFGGWQAWLERAAAWAPGGPALWLGDEPELVLPSGFAWTVAPVGDAGRLPENHYRLVVVGPAEDSAHLVPRLVGLIEAGGVLLGPVALDGAQRVAARTLDRASDSDLAILRRE